MTECMSCHGYHDIAQPDRNLFDTACGRCHPPDTPGFATAQKLKTLLSQTDDSLAATTDELTRVAQTSPTVVRLLPRLYAGRAYFMEALPVQHALDVQRVGDLTRGARSISEEIRAALHGTEEDNRVRYLFLGLAWIYILFVVVVAYRYRSACRREAARRAAGGA
jgi:hypothetical protein